MTVGELIAELSKLDSALLVVQSKDEEGNGFSPFSDLGFGWYRAETTWHGEYYDDADDEYEPVQGDVQAVCLWPTN